MALNVNIVFQDHVSVLVKRHGCLGFLKDVYLTESNSFKWNRSTFYSYDIQVIFLGKTGYGKSSTINSIIGKESVFETDDVKSCTKDLYSAEFKLNETEPFYFSLGDLPGIGESLKVDEKYVQWYKDFVARAHCIVYLLRADLRDYVIDEKLFLELFNTKSMRSKVILALNYADKIEPVNRREIFTPSDEQKRNLQEKVKNVANLFGIGQDSVIYYSAKESYNISTLVESIAKKVKSNLL